MAAQLTAGQKQFVRHLAGETGLNSKVLQAWVLAEENGGAAAGRQASHNHNWLNIAYFDSGAGSLTKNKVWSHPNSAAHATAQFLKGEKYGASAGIRKILSTKGQDVNSQISAIANSGWASSRYNNGDTLRSLVGQVGHLHGVTASVQGTPRRASIAAVSPRSDGLDVRSAVLDTLRAGQGSSIEAVKARLMSGNYAAKPTTAKPTTAKPTAAPKAGVSVARAPTKTGLIHAVQALDTYAGMHGVITTAKQEPGHASGGDHDPSVANATARDFGGTEEQRQRFFNTLTSSLGVKAQYKGADVNVVKNGIRYQIISRDHGTGPHLHVGLRVVGQ